ncbi:Aminoacyl tRNA synthase complex interacting [Paragonimus heterotremus]|uniref:Aminoacyl tRNA synthase complex interacting n=1 Tax=Paragonimus heterotremus TaxID=100268 RepID=A0A8J4WPT1_9TREM|nr:Aminoacyl tRNA synthase complex interacting [Paragonimus heterotremus]
MELASKIGVLQRKINSLRSAVTPDSINYVEKVLRQENSILEQKIIELKEKLCMTELLFGILQYKTPTMLDVNSRGVNNSATIPITEPTTTTVTTPKVTTPPVAQSTQSKVSNALADSSKSKSAGGGGGKNVSKSGGHTGSADAAVDVGRLDMRVGRIVEVQQHPDADSLYVEKVDLGEGRLRTVVSGLVKFVPIEALQDRVGIFMCNLKPAKMRGVESEAMLMCASAPDVGQVEPLILESSTEVQLGEPVVVPGFAYNPDEQLNPKKKIFEQVKPDLRVDQDGFATYKNVRWILKNCPNVSVKASKLRDVQIA